jgi:kynurenine formamidase
MRAAAIFLAGLCAAGCHNGPEQSNSSIPLPREVIDLGALITEDTPRDFWGSGFFNEMGFTQGNRFDVIAWDYGPVSGTNSYFRLFNHGGPHVDAPSHIGLDGALDSFPVEAFTGPLKVFDFSHLDIGRSISVGMMEALPISAGDVVLIYTGYSAPASEGMPEAVALTYEAARYLADIPVRAFGTDAFNVESMTDQSPIATDNEIAQVIPAHHAFLSHGIPVFEQLVNLESLLEKSNMYFVGAPLNIRGGDGMMVRPVVLIY